VRPRHRDGLLALLATAGLVAVAWWGRRLRTLTRPFPFVAGAAGAVALELLMAWYPERSAALWAKWWVQALSTVGVVLLALAAAFLAPWVLAVLFGGLIAYFVLLGLVLTGLLPGAETWFDR
jgi:hypothetical protein